MVGKERDRAAGSEINVAVTGTAGRRDTGCKLPFDAGGLSHPEPSDGVIRRATRIITVRFFNRNNHKYLMLQTAQCAVLRKEETNNDHSQRENFRDRLPYP